MDSRTLTLSPLPIVASRTKIYPPGRGGGHPRLVQDGDTGVLQGEAGGSGSLGGPGIFGGHGGSSVAFIFLALWMNGFWWALARSSLWSERHWVRIHLQ